MQTVALVGLETAALLAAWGLASAAGRDSPRVGVVLLRLAGSIATNLYMIVVHLLRRSVHAPVRPHVDGHPRGSRDAQPTGAKGSPKRVDIVQAPSAHPWRVPGSVALVGFETRDTV